MGFKLNFHLTSNCFVLYKFSNFQNKITKCKKKLFIDLFKVNQLCILHVQIFINFLSLLELIYFYFCTFKTSQHKPITFETKTLI